MTGTMYGSISIMSRRISSMNEISFGIRRLHIAGGGSLYLPAFRYFMLCAVLCIAGRWHDP